MERRDIHYLVENTEQKIGVGQGMRNQESPAEIGRLINLSAWDSNKGSDMQEELA